MAAHVPGKKSAVNAKNVLDRCKIERHKRALNRGQRIDRMTDQEQRLYPSEARIQRHRAATGASYNEAVSAIIASRIDRIARHRAGEFIGCATPMREARDHPFGGEFVRAIHVPGYGYAIVDAEG
jgi:hypothetical protein